MVLQMGVLPPASSLLSKSIGKVSITATCRLEWHYQLSKKIMAFSLSNWSTMILFQGRHLMGVLECHQSTPPNKMVELKTNELCVKNQVKFIGAIRVSRCRFCRIFFPTKPTSTHTYCKKAIRVSKYRFGRINISTVNFTSMKKKSRRTYIYSHLL